jgi:hypothetical protein
MNIAKNKIKNTMIGKSNSQFLDNNHFKIANSMTTHLALAGRLEGEWMCGTNSIKPKAVFCQQN